MSEAVNTSIFSSTGREMEIVSLRPEHAALLARLQRCTFEQAYSGVHAPENIAAYCSCHYTEELARADLSSRGVVACIGVLESKPLGYYLLKADPCPIPLNFSCIELKQIYILRKAYGSGLGSALFQHAVASVKSKGDRGVWLCVSDKNCRAKAFYDKLGFNFIGPGPDLAVGNDRLASSILALEF